MKIGRGKIEMEKWAIKPIYTGKNIFDYAEAHYNGDKLELYDTYEQAEKRKNFMERKKNIQCEISKIELAIQNEECSCLRIV